MRIIAGRLRGRRLAAVRGRVRPTADRVREAIFNVLGNQVAEARVLDLFAGTGALGIEAISRGAREAVFVEQHHTALRVLRKNLGDCGLSAMSQVFPLGVSRALKRLATQGQKFDLVFLDPPYGQGLAAKTIRLLAPGQLLSPAAQVIVEHSRQEQVPATCQSLTQVEQRHYGDTVISFYAPVRAAEPGLTEPEE